MSPISGLGCSANANAHDKLRENPKSRAKLSKCFLHEPTRPFGVSRTRPSLSFSLLIDRVCPPPSPTSFPKVPWPEKENSCFRFLASWEASGRIPFAAQKPWPNTADTSTSTRHAVRNGPHYLTARGPLLRHPLPSFLS